MFFQDRPALDVLSGRHFLGTTVDVLSGPSYGWLQVVMDGYGVDGYEWLSSWQNLKPVLTKCLWRSWQNLFQTKCLLTIPLSFFPFAIHVMFLSIWHFLCCFPVAKWLIRTKELIQRVLSIILEILSSRFFEIGDRRNGEKMVWRLR